MAILVRTLLSGEPVTVTFSMTFGSSDRICQRGLFVDNLDRERHTRPDVFGAVVEGVPVCLTFESQIRHLDVGI